MCIETTGYPWVLTFTYMHRLEVGTETRFGLLLQFKNGASPGDELNKSPCASRKERPRLLKDKTHRPTFPSRIFSISVPDWLLGKNDFGKYSRECSRTVSFVFEQSGSPFPARGLIILVTRRSVRIKDNYSPQGKFHRFLFPVSSKFSDLNRFASYVLFIYPYYAA